MGEIEQKTYKQEILLKKKKKLDSKNDSKLNKRKHTSSYS